MSELILPHQDQGADWLAARPRAYLGDTPGLGKTRTALLAASRKQLAFPLVVCPAIVRTHWRQEWETLGRPFDVVTYSYEQIVRGGYSLMRDLLRDGVDGLILDEAHYLKHRTSQRAQFLLGKNGYARRLNTVWALSGTPQPRHPGELYTVMYGMFPEILREYNLARYGDWEQTFCLTVPRQVRRGKWINKVVGTRNMPLLREILGRVMLRRTLTDVGLTLPELEWQVLRLDGEDHYLNSTSIIPEELAPLVKALQEGRSLAELAADPHTARARRKLGELKVKPALDMLRPQLEDSNEQIVVFAHHRSVLGELRAGLAKFGVSYVDGDTPQAERDRAIQTFQASATRVFLGQIIACQTGITLTASSRVVLVEPDWTAVVNAQAAHRVARIGQAAARCMVQMIALAGTLDEAIVAQNARETRIAAETFRKEVAA